MDLFPSKNGILRERPTAFDPDSEQIHRKTPLLCRTMCHFGDLPIENSFSCQGGFRGSSIRLRRIERLLRDFGDSFIRSFSPTYYVTHSLAPRTDPLRTRPCSRLSVGIVGLATVASSLAHRPGTKHRLLGKPCCVLCIKNLFCDEP